MLGTLTLMLLGSVQALACNAWRPFQEWEYVGLEFQLLSSKLFN